MKWSDALGVLSKLAPSLASAAGGPLAGSAVTALEKVLGLNPDGDLSTRQDSITATLSAASPDVLLAVHKADQDFSARMAELGFENAAAIAKLGNEDRASARGREMSLKDRTPALLAFAVTVGFFGILIFMLVRPLPAGSREVLLLMLGSLGSAWIAITSYYFGSSSDSSRKTELLAGAGK